MRDWHHMDDLSVVCYHQGELASQERLEFEQHLAVCAECQQELNSLRRLDQLTSNVPQLELPPELAASLVRTPITSVTPMRRNWLAPALGLAAAVAIAALVFRPGQPPEVACSHSPEMNLPPKLTPATPGEGSTATVLATSSLPKMWHSDGRELSFQLVGQTVVLAPNSEVERISVEQQHALLKLRFGMVRVKETGQHISVMTSHLQVRPIGTDYQVSTNLKTSQVKVNQGAVEVTSDKHRTVKLSAGGSLSWPEVEPAQPVQSASPTAEPSSQPRPVNSPQLPDSDYPTGRQSGGTHLPTPAPSPAAPASDPLKPDRFPEGQEPYAPTPQPPVRPGQERPLPPDGPPGYNHPPHPPGGRPGGPGHLPPHLRPRFPGEGRRTPAVRQDFRRIQPLSTTKKDRLALGGKTWLDVGWLT